MRSKILKFFFPSWGVLALPLLWLVIMVSFAAIKPVRSNEFVLTLENNTNGEEVAKLNHPMLIKPTLYYTARAILSMGLVLYLLSCCAFFVYSGYTKMVSAKSHKRKKRKKRVK
jgi:hypothetical protein